MALCAKCGTNVGCACNLVEGMCVSCRNSILQQQKLQQEKDIENDKLQANRDKLQESLQSNKTITI